MEASRLFRDMPAFLGNGPPNHLGEWLNEWGDEIAYMRNIRDVARLLIVCKPHGAEEVIAWQHMKAMVGPTSGCCASWAACRCGRIARST